MNRALSWCVAPTALPRKETVTSYKLRILYYANAMYAIAFRRPSLVTGGSSQQLSFFIFLLLKHFSAFHIPLGNVRSIVRPYVVPFERASPFPSKNPLNVIYSSPLTPLSSSSSKPSEPFLNVAKVI